MSIRYKEEISELKRKKVIITCEIPFNKKDKVEAKCLKCSYEWKIGFGSLIKSNIPCEHCRGRVKLESDYIKGLKERNIEWIGKTVPKTTKKETWFKCLVCNRPWKSCYDNVQGKRKHGCTNCANNTSHSVEDYHKRDKDDTLMIECVTPNKDIPKSAHTKCLWRCRRKGCKIIATYHDVINKNRKCLTCFPVKIPRERYLDVKNNRSLMWMETKEIPKTTRTHCFWKCLECDHEWEQTYVVVNEGTGCPECAGNLRKTEDDYKNKGGKDYLEIEWIGEELPTNTKEPTLWKCKVCLEEITKSYGDIITAEVGCTNCGLKSEGECRRILEGLFKDRKFPKRSKFLYSERLDKWLEYDGYNEDLKLAFEYQGEQHYKYYPKHFHKAGYHKFEEQKERDKEKLRLSKEKGIIVIMIPYTCRSYRQKEKFIREQCEKEFMVLSRDEDGVFDVLDL